MDNSNPGLTQGDDQASDTQEERVSSQLPCLKRFNITHRMPYHLIMFVAV